MWAKFILCMYRAVIAIYGTVIGICSVMEAGPTASRCATWSRNNTIGHALRVPVVYDFDSDEEDDVYAEEVLEVVLPLCASFDSLTREEANR